MAFEGIIRGINLWNNSLFPSIFPILIISDFILSTDLVYYINRVWGNVFRKLFKVSGYGSYVFIMSMFCGCPSNAKYVSDLLNNNIINKDEAIKILSMSLLYNPLLIIAITPYLSFSKQLLIIFGNLVCNFIIGLLNRSYKANISSYNYIKKNFNLVNSISNAINTLLLILGIVTMFLCVTTIIDNNINLNNYNQSILNGFFEMTQGLKYVSILDIPLKFKSTVATMILSFGGLSVHMQVLSIISDTKIKYLPFFTSRILHASIASLLCYILFDFWI